MKVMKFGGVILRDRDGFEALLDVLGRYKDENILLVISAFSTATRDLRRAARTAEKGNEEEAYSMLDRIIRVHINFALALLKDGRHSLLLEQSIESMHNELMQYLRGISITREVTPRTMDLVMSYGELLALKIISAFLNGNDYRHLCIDSTELIVSDSNFGSANPDLEKTGAKIEEKLIPLIENNKLIVTQGFVARDTNGEIATMGIESSNLTAMIYAILLKSGELTIWTDVEGIRSADPKLAENTLPIPELSLNEAMIASKSGFKLIIEPMVKLLSDYHLKLIYKSAFNPDGDSTFVGNDSNTSGMQFSIVKSNLFCIISDKTENLKLTGEGLFSGLIKDSFYNIFLTEEAQDNIKLRDECVLFENVALIVVINCKNSSASKILASISGTGNGAELLHYSYLGHKKTLSILLQAQNISKYIEFIQTAI